MPPSRPSTRVSIRAEFCAASRLWREDWSPERNREVYGICASPHGHGHNYLLTVTVEGEPDLETGMLMDYTVLQAAVDEHLVRAVDHLNLNVDVPFLDGKVPTTENLLAAFWRVLLPHLPTGVALHSMELRESRDTVCTYFGPSDER